MIKVSMWFAVDEETANEAIKKMRHGEMGEAAEILNSECEESDYDYEESDYDYEDYDLLVY